MSTSIIVPCRNEAGTIVKLLESILDSLNPNDELIVVEGNSNDDTWNQIQEFTKNKVRIKLLKQANKGKFDAVLMGLKYSTSQYIMIWDADGTVSLEDNLEIYNFSTEKDYFMTGDRLYGVRETGSMRYANYLANWFFAIWWGLILGTKPTDSLCGSKKFPKAILNKAPGWLINHDPYGDFSMLAMAKFHNLEFTSLPVRYGARQYGVSNIRRWRGGISLLALILRISAHTLTGKFNLLSKA